MEIPAFYPEAVKGISMSDPILITHAIFFLPRNHQEENFQILFFPTYYERI